MVAMVAVAALTLTGCGALGEELLGASTSYADTRAWLEEQPIVASIDEPSEFYDGFARQGELHAELDPAASPEEVEEFAVAAARFLDTEDRAFVDLYAGREHIDFVVGDESAVREALPIWQQVAGLSDIRAALVGRGTVVARGVRADLPAMVDALQTLDAGFEAQGLADSAALDEAVETGSYYDSVLHGQNGVNPHPLDAPSPQDDDIVSILAAGDCAPAPGVLSLALEVTADGPHGSLDLCQGWALDYAGLPIGEAAIALRARLDAAGVTDLSVWAVSRVPIPDAQVREVRVLPGSAEGLEILHALDAVSVLPEKAGYTLDENRDLLLTSFDEPNARLVALLVAAPGAAALGTVEVRGEDLAVTGTIDRLQEFQDDAAALDSATPVFSYLDVAADTALLHLVYDPADRPTESAIRDAARALHDGDIWSTRQVTLESRGASFVIDAGDAADLDVSATRSESLVWFHDEWLALSS